ncbi:hypothetical protein [Yersinia bercovieri]|uniref:hypothetical protein n=1 Tax=Yersinia bercovieri TaxID=634 RepID=UPI0011A7B30B|nr:hypothetical protein [Yersinia bercovieri]MCB5303870.1 hypothetical protein [Yersinia bercovieri]
MICNFKRSSMCSWLLLVFVSSSCSADDDWIKREAHMACGSAVVQVNAECKADPRDTTVNICQKYQLNIKKNNKISAFPIPYMPNSQRKTLEKQGYLLNEIVKVGDWTPQTMSCYDSEYIVISYTTGMNDEESVDGSLTSNSSSPFFNLNGEFILGEKESELREREIRRGGNYTYLNFSNK